MVGKNSKFEGSAISSRSHRRSFTHSLAIHYHSSDHNHDKCVHVPKRKKKMAILGVFFFRGRENRLCGSPIMAFQKNMTHPFDTTSQSGDNFWDPQTPCVNRQRNSGYNNVWNNTVTSHECRIRLCIGKE